MRFRPHVSTVHRHVDWDIADDFYSLAVDVIAQFVPLFEEQVLDVGEEIDVFPVFFAAACQSFPAAVPDVLRPFGPGAHAVMLLAGHEQCVVRKPFFILPDEGIDRFTVTRKAPFRRQPQHVETVLVDLPVVDVAGLASPFAVLHLFGLQQTVFDQHVRIDQVRIAGKGGKALIRRIAVAGRAEREDLPETLSGLHQKVREFVG